MLDIDKMNDCLLLGLYDMEVAKNNEKGYDLMHNIVSNHFYGDRAEEIEMIMDDMHSFAFPE